MFDRFDPKAVNVLTGIGIILVLAIVTLIVGVVVYRLVKRRVSRQGEFQPLTLQDVRRMHREGQITDQEFAQLKDKLTSQKLEELGMASGGPVAEDHDAERADEPEDGPEDSDKTHDR